MSVSSTTNRVSFAGNGSTTVFSYPYYLQSSADLVVISKDDTTGVETTKTLTTHYTFSGTATNNIYPSGGSVTMLVAPASGTTLTIYVDPALTQTLDLTENDISPAESQEQAWDKLTMIAQRLKSLILRSVRLSDGFSDTFTLTLPPDLADGADKALSINSTGDGFALMEDSPSIADIADAAANAAAAAASASAAAASETAAAGSETAAAASAASAAASLASAFFRDVVYITSADSPYTITQASHNGKLISINSSGGAVAITLPQISTLSPPFNVGFLLATAGNTVTVSRSGSDTIGGNTSKTMSTAGYGLQVVADADAAPDDYSVLVFGDPAAATISGSKTANYSATLSDEIILCDATSGAFTVSLPTAVGCAGKVYEIKKIDSLVFPSYAVTVDPSGAETIDGYADMKVGLYKDSIRIVSDGTNWRCLKYPRVVCHYTNTSGQSIPTNSLTVLTHWNQKIQDPHGCLSGGQTFTAPYDGEYMVAAKGGFSANATGTRRFQIEYSPAVGSGMTVGYHEIYPVATGPSFILAFTPVYLLAGDTVYVRAWQSAGSNQTTTSSSYGGGATITTEFSVIRIG